MARKRPDFVCSNFPRGGTYRRFRLPSAGRNHAGDRIAGPAILMQLDATTLLLPDQTAEVHRFGSLVVHDQ